MKRPEEIIVDLDRGDGNERDPFLSGVSYRHLMVFQNGAQDFPPWIKLELTPPHDITGKEIASFLPRDGGSKGVEEIEDSLDH